MSDFLNRMKSAAKADLKTIVLPEGEDPRTIVAATKIIEEGLAKIVILGNPDEINVPGATVIDPRNAEKHEEYAQKFAELRAKKGVTIEQARAQVMDATYFGTMMVKMGDADGLVSGACHSTADTLRPALQILKTAPGTKLVSAFFIMCTDEAEYGEDGALLFADCGLNINPTADELSEIAIASAETWRSLMSEEPKVAMLSFTLELDRRLRKSGSNIVALSAHPGFASTNIHQNSAALQPKSAFDAWRKKKLEPLIPRADQAARPIVHAATADTVQGGEYYGPKGLFEIAGKKVGKARINPVARDTALGKRLWTLSESMTGVRYLSDL